MTQSRDRRLSELFEAALDRSPEERPAFLQDHCADDPRLLEEVLELLSHLSGPDPLLEPPRMVHAEGSARGSGAPGIDDVVPEVIGPYRLLEVIAEGGMGTVYRAEQSEPVQRTVALKLVKIGMDTKRLLARFRAERQTLALMDHPHVTRIFDAGSTPSGRPYFVMEYFPGRALTSFADEEALTIRERLRLFLQACSAVHSAHQKGVIHRDLKPSNLLVMRMEGRPVLKVIDFGISKVLDPDADGVDGVTRVGEIIGTPDYMSPEQTGRGAGTCDTTSDVYSLGVVLYELLTGALPHERAAVGSTRASGPQHHSMAATRPSHRVSTDHPDPVRASQNRRTDRTTLTRMLRRDLDWVVLKALEPDQARRYQTVHEFAADIERFLDGEPVLAVAPTRRYRAQKFLQRYRTLVMATASVVLTLVAGIASTSWYAFEAGRARARQVSATELAVREAEIAERNAYVASVVAANTAFSQGDMSAVRRYLDRAPAHLRGWEWDYLSTHVDDSVLRIALPAGHRMEGRTSAAILPGDERVAALARTAEQGVYLEWDLRTGALLRERAFEDDGGRACMSSDGTWLARNERGRLVVERAATGETRDVVIPPSLQSRTASLFTSDGDRIVLTDAGHPLDDVVIDLRTGEILARPATNYESTASADTVVVLSIGEIELRETGTGRPLRRFVEPSREITNFCVDRASRRLYWTELEGVLGVRSLTGAPLSWQQTDPDRAKLLALALDGRGHVLVGGAARSIDVVDASTGVRVAAFHGHRETIEEIDVGRTQPIAVSRSASEILVWDLRSEHEERDVLYGHRAPVYPVAFDRDGQWLVSGGWDGRLVVWDVRSREAVRTMAFADPSHSSIRALAVDGDRDEVIALATRAARARVLVRAGLHTASIDSVELPPERNYAGVALDPRRHRAASVWFVFGGTAGLIVHDLDSMTPIHQEQNAKKGIDEHAHCLDYRPDGDRLAISTGDGRLRILDGEDFTVVQSLDLGPTFLTAIAWSPDGARLATARRDGTIVLRDASTLDVITELLGHSGFVYGLCWSPDGSRLFSSGEDRLVRVWNAGTGEEVLRLAGHESYVYGIAMSPAGTILASGSGDGTVRLWGRDGVPSQASGDADRAAVRPSRVD